MKKEVEQLRSKLNLWRNQAEARPLSMDADDLTSLCNEATRLLEQDYSSDVVHLADEIYGFAADRGLALRVELHRKYSKYASAPKEVFWSRWQLVDTLALLKRCDEAVDEQLDFYKWSRQQLTAEYTLQTLYDSTQAQCWVAIGRFDDWATLYFEGVALLESRDTQRRTQCLFLRTGAEMFLQQGRFDDAYEQVVQLEHINNEKPEWADYLVFWGGAITARLEIFRRQNQWSEYEKVVQQALVVLRKQFEALPDDRQEQEKVYQIAHDVGCCLVWAKHYTRAKPLLEFVAGRQGSGITHLFLAACIWRADKDRAATLKYLRLAQQTTKDNWLLRGRYRQFFLEMEDFADVHEDAEFLEAFREE